MSNLRRLFAGVAAAAFLCLLCSGCVEGHMRTLARYDAPSDSFVFMQVYSDIYTEKAEETDYLEALYKRRDALLVNPIEIKIFSVSAYERLDAHTYINVNLGSKTDAKPETTKVDLSAIKITPGGFCLSAKKNLCYYQQNTVPGSVVDAVLPELTSSISGQVKNGIDAEIKRVKAAKGPPLTWDEVRKKLLEEMTKDPLAETATPTDPQKNDPKAEGERAGPLSMESLELIAKAANFDTFKIKRNGELFTVTLPLTKADSTEILTTIQLIKDNLPGYAQKQKIDVEQMKLFAKALDAVSFRYVEGSGLEVTVPALKLLTKAYTLFNDAETPADKAALSKQTATTIEGRGIKIDRQTSIEDVMMTFLGK